MAMRRKMYKQTKNYENLQKRIFDGVGEYGIPQIEPTQYKECDWIGFNYARSEKDRTRKGVHFFLDDYTAFEEELTLDVAKKS